MGGRRARTALIGVLACALAAACGPEPPAAAPPPPRPEREEAARRLDASRRTAIVAATERVAPAVVSVTAYQTRVVRGRVSAPNDIFDLFFRDFLPPTRLYRERIPSLGSGVIVRPGGAIVTNHHVVADADEVYVTLHDGRTLPARTVAAHAFSDVAVLHVEPGDLPAATLGASGDLLVGEWVIAVGNPFGQLISDAEPTVTIGVVSAKRRSFLPRRRGERKYIDMIQTDAAINPGNSGGALANAVGEVVGINTFILSRSGGSMGLGFAIPIDHVKRVLDEYEQHGAVRSVWLGFTVGQITAEMRQALRLGDVTGAVVVEVHRRGPAYAAGLRPGDVIQRIDGRPIGDAEAAEVALGYVFAGDVYELDIWRRGAAKTLALQAVRPE